MNLETQMLNAIVRSSSCMTLTFQGQNMLPHCLDKRSSPPEHTPTVSVEPHGDIVEDSQQQRPFRLVLRTFAIVTPENRHCAAHDSWHTVCPL